MEVFILKTALDYFPPRTCGLSICALMGRISNFEIPFGANRVLGAGRKEWLPPKTYLAMTNHSPFLPADGSCPQLLGDRGMAS